MCLGESPTWKPWCEWQSSRCPQSEEEWGKLSPIDFPLFRKLKAQRAAFGSRRNSKEIQLKWPFNWKSSFPKFFISTNRIEATDRPTERPQCTLEHISNSLQSHISHLHLWYERKNDIYLFSNNNLTTILQFMNWIELLCIFGINYLAIRLHNRNSLLPFPSFPRLDLPIHTWIAAERQR